MRQKHMGYGGGVECLKGGDLGGDVRRRTER